MNQLAEAEIEMARHARASATEALERGRQTLREVRENRLLAELGLGSMLPGRSEGTSLLCAEALKRCQQGHSACQRTGQLMDEMVRTVGEAREQVDCAGRRQQSKRTAGN